MFDYNEYARLFNEGDDLAHTHRFFADDFAFVGSSRSVQSKEGYLKFLAFVHDGILERMRPQRVVREGNFIFADIDMDFHATKARTDFPFGVLQPGDLVTVKFFVTYTLNAQDKIQELKAMTWAPGKGVTSIPRLGAHASQQAAFQAYLAAFSNADTARLSAFYTDDIVLNLPTQPLKGKQAVIDFYGAMFPKVREQITIKHFTASDSDILLEAETRFTAQTDAPDFLVMPLKQGEAAEMAFTARYSLRSGLIDHIHIERMEAPRKVTTTATA